ncbi:MAG TPA: hypothetical protein VIF62_35245, partial [Labilithrix sp.]
MRAGLYAVLMLAACGGVQEATLSPAMPAPKIEGDDGTRMDVDPPGSRIVVAARDVAHGSHPLRFEKFHGTLVVDRAGGGRL